ncbi:hypothetical protein BC830DRAFT_869196 [Chytriomyces sp. MP71]|nr:hypothetical protein BC830DRAFT_869196 [Chytriomyces sp. MP71]
MGDQPPYTQPHGLASAPALPHPQPLQYPAAVSNGRTATSQLQQQPPSTLATVGMRVRENYNAHQTGVTSLPPLNQMTHLPPPSQQQQHYHLQEPSRPIIRSNSHGYGSERNFDSDNGHPPTSHLPPPSNFHSQPPPPQNGHDYGYGQQQHYYSQASPNQGYYPPQPPSHHRHQQQYPPHPNSSYQQHHQEQPQPYADQHYGNYSNGGYQESPQYHHPTYSPNYPVQRSPPLPPKQSPMIRSQSLQDQRAFPQLPGPHDYHPQPTHHQVYSQTPQPMQGYQDNILFPPRSPPIPGRQLPAPPHSAYNPGHPLQYQPPLSPPRNATLPPPIPSNYAPNQSYQPPLREFIHAQDRYPAPPQRHEPIQIDRMSGSGGVDTRVGPKKRGRPPKLPAPYAVYAPEPDAKRARGAGGYSVVDLTRVDSVPSVFDSTDSFHDGMYAVDGNIATMGVPATLYGGRKPAIGDDLDPATLAVAHPLHPLPVVGGTALVMIPVVSSTVAGAFDGVASAKEKIGAEEMMKKSGAENMEKLVVKADADEKENIKEKNQDGGSSSGGLAVSEESSNDVVLDKTMLDAQKRRLSLPEALDFLSVVDFLREFGSVLLKLNGMDSLSLGKSLLHHKCLVIV